MENSDLPRMEIFHHSECEAVDIPANSYFIDAHGIFWHRDNYAWRQVTDTGKIHLIKTVWSERQKRAQDATNIELKPEHYGEF